MYTPVGENWTREIDFSRHEDNLPSHRGRRLQRKAITPPGFEPGTSALSETRSTNGALGAHDGTTFSVDIGVADVTKNSRLFAVTSTTCYTL